MIRQGWQKTPVLLLLVFLCLGCVAAPASTPKLPPPSSASTSVFSQAPPEKELDLRVIPSLLKPGIRTTLLGTGFEELERVEFYFTRPDGTQTEAASSTADLNGGVFYIFDVPADWTEGNWIAHVQSKDHPSRKAETHMRLEKKN